ncbi:RDD family protein [Nocardioides sp. SYSU D00038]|uniref:RDD family protein n=1 Tax=Nocardioides sp. SYSU D00038 TaxID=2812554 RepID=UPI001968103F|nr:RDD family protein [Nocardioides sp. SYSU D00038]
MTETPPPPPAGDPTPPPAGGAVPPPPPAPATPPPAAAPVAGVPRPAELLDRFLARLIDSVIVGIPFGILTAIFSGIFLNGFIYSTGELFLYGLFTGVVGTVLFMGYQVFLETSQGATFGKQIMKLKVYGPDGTSHPTVEQSVKRNIWNAFPLAYIVPIGAQAALAGLAALVAEVLIAVNIQQDTVKRQGWHDKFAGGTQVMKVG